MEKRRDTYALVIHRANGQYVKTITGLSHYKAKALARTYDKSYKTYLTREIGTVLPYGSHAKRKREKTD